MRQTMKQLSILLALAAGLCACVGRSESSIGTPGSPLVVLLSPAHAPAPPATTTMPPDMPALSPGRAPPSPSPARWGR